jgi:hypothetical protein
MGSRLLLIGETNAVRRRCYFHLVGPDGITPATLEAGGQPEASIDGAAWVGATNIGTLTAIANGRYYATLTPAAVAAGEHIETRYRSANTAECPGDSFDVVPYKPGDEMAQTTVQAAPAPTTTTFTGGTELIASATAYPKAAVLFLSGQNKGLARKITGYTAGRAVTVEALPFAPAAGDRFGIVGVIE